MHDDHQCFIKILSYYAFISMKISSLQFALQTRTNSCMFRRNAVKHLTFVCVFLMLANLLGICLLSLLNTSSMIFSQQLDVIGIDEAQFFGDLYEFCCKAADHDGKTVIVAGLDGDYLRFTPPGYSFISRFSSWLPAYHCENFFLFINMI